MSSPKLYAFFCAEECKKNEELILRIDNNLKTIYEVYSYCSINIYDKYKHINSILPENKLFFSHLPLLTILMASATPPLTPRYPR